MLLLIIALHSFEQEQHVAQKDALLHMCWYSAHIKAVKPPQFQHDRVRLHLCQGEAGLIMCVLQCLAERLHCME